MQMHSPTEWNDLAVAIDPSFTVDISKIPDQALTAQEFRGYCTDAGATWDEALAPLDELVSQYGE